MLNFVEDNLSLPFPKTDITPIPSGADPTQYVDASDWNRVCQAEVDIRTFLQTASLTVPVTRQVIAGTGLTGTSSLANDITLALADIVTPGSYTNTNLTVNAKGQITAAASGSGPSLEAIATSGSASDLIAGTVPAARMPALTGNVTSSAGSVATTIAAHVVTAAMQTQMAAFRIKGNNTGSTADEIDLTTAQILAMLNIGIGGFGPATDGSVVFDGAAAVAGYSGPVSNVYTATREAFFQNVTINGSVVVNQHTFPGPNVRGTLTNNGDLNWSGADASGATGGLASASTGPLPAGTAGGGGGAANTNGTNGTSSNNAPRGFSTTSAAGGIGQISPTPPTPAGSGGIGHGGGGGGSLANGGSGGVVSLVAASNGDWQDKSSASMAILLGGGSVVKMTASTGGGGGAGGGTGSVGGGAGAGGSWAVVRAFAFAGSGTYTARGGNGANGTSPTSGSNQGGGGGGGSGSGGVVVVVTADQAPPTFNVAAGTPGSGAVGNGSGQTGAVGASGGVGLVLVFN